MDQRFSSSVPAAVPQSVRIARHAAAVLLSATQVILCCAVAIVSFEDLRTVGLIASCIFLIAWLLLCRIATDAPTKAAMAILAVLSLTAALLQVRQEVLSADVSGLYVACSNLLAVYALSLLFRNPGLATADRSWIGLLILGNTFEIVTLFTDAYVSLLSSAGLDHSHLWYCSRYYVIYFRTWHVLAIVAYWRLAHCDLFAGRPKEAAPALPGICSPLNRCMAAVSVAAAAAAGGMYLMYAHAAWFIE